MSGAERLPNGNTLICEGSEGHFFEIDSDSRIVWEYINPVRQGGPVTQGNEAPSNDVFRAYRYGADYPAFEGRPLFPMGAIEFNPFSSDCPIHVDR